jgi:alpha-beta hydrolase superfamily lysophospholipase
VNNAWSPHQGYLTSGGNDLLVHLFHQPVPAPTVLISAALGVTFTEPRYLMTHLARRLAAGGANVVQYDHPADGDSTGDQHAVTVDDLLAAARTVLSFCRELSPMPIAVVGYGAGNVVAASLATEPDVRAAVLLAPCFRAWQWDWSALCPPGPDGLVAAEVTPDGSDRGDVWRAVYGEPVVPSQPPGPVGADLLAGLALHRPRIEDADTIERTLVISDLDEDISSSKGATHSIGHTASPDQPSWHWNLRCRSEVIDSVDTWVLTRLPAVETGEDGRSPDARSGTSRLKSSTADGASTVHALQIGEDTVFGVLRRPVRPSVAPDLCVVYETGNPGQRVDVHRCGPVIAERFAERGFASFRYDPRGMGCSLGDYSKMTWSLRLADGSAVHDFLRSEGFRSFAILGNSAGGRVGLRMAADGKGAQYHVLWGPILREADDDTIDPALVRAPGGLAIEWCGLPLGLRYQRDLRDFDYLAAIADDRTPTCVIFADDEPDLENLEEVKAALADRVDVVLETAAGQHGFSWLGLGEAIRKSLDWLESAQPTGEDR